MGESEPLRVSECTECAPEPPVVSFRTDSFVLSSMHKGVPAVVEDAALRRHNELVRTATAEDKEVRAAAFRERMHAAEERRRAFTAGIMANLRAPSTG